MGIPEPETCEVAQPGNNIREGEQFCGFFAAVSFSTVNRHRAPGSPDPTPAGMWDLCSAGLLKSRGILLSICLNKYMAFHDIRTNLLRRFPVLSAISENSLIQHSHLPVVKVGIIALRYPVGKMMAVPRMFFRNYVSQSRFTFRQ